jgi:hypothetical protein
LKLVGCNLRSTIASEDWESEEWYQKFMERNKNGKGLFMKLLGAMQTTTTVLAFAAALTGCAPAHYVTKEEPNYDPTVSARIRILTGNDLQNAAFRPGACYTTKLQDDPTRVDVSDGFLARYKYSSRSITIGMPPSPRPWMRVGGLRFKDMIREYIVKAGQPVALSMSTASDVGSSQSGGYHWSCSASDSTFTPAAGQDYDVYLSFQQEGHISRGCSIEVRRIGESGLDEPVATNYAPRCAIPEHTATPIKRSP